MWLKFLHSLNRVVDKREACTLSAAVLRSETEDGDLVFAGFVEFGELATEFVFRDIGTVGMEDIADRDRSDS